MYKFSNYQSFKMSCTIECPICFDEIKDKNSIVTECGHNFHASCIMTNINRNGFVCPCCRAIMAEDNHVDDDSSSSDDDESSDYDDDSSTLIDYGKEPYSEEALRGLRFLTNLLEGVPHEQTDVIDEYQYIENQNVNENRPAPPIDSVTRSLREQGVTYEELVAAILSDHQEYADDKTLDRVQRNIWGRFCVFISNYTPEHA